MPLNVSVVTPEREVWSGEADFVVARADGGDIGILPGHAPFLGALHHARMEIHTADSKLLVAVHSGFIEVFKDAVSVLTQIAETSEEIDVDRARRQLENAKRRLEAEDSHENRAKLLRAQTRLDTAREGGRDR